MNLLNKLEQEEGCVLVGKMALQAQRGYRRNKVHTGKVVTLHKTMINGKEEFAWQGRQQQYFLSRRSLRRLADNDRPLDESEGSSLKVIKYVE
ncbi:hypothetical protein PoB_007318000 [Plakobranchus ocellatus]|uniref:Uncharacterized protein n=1 Tax=Plakobranchus ocellatus TaxID=259542 RepID=A0AAV4DRA1_9GAST|nr:hypothetical protein PoB_007318000 [Plakobranchus ocellatus]